MKVVSVVGARPQFVKLAPVSHALTAAGHEHVIVHSGQHYDELMSDVFFSDLGIPAPDVNLEVGSGGHGAQTGSVLERLDPVLEGYAPDWVLCYGDTNTTLAAAIAAVKLHLPTAHLEAGLRSFNRRMPEEHNRVLTDHAADLLLAPTALAMRNLSDEGLADRSVLVGDVMTDVCLGVAASVRGTRPPIPEDIADDYVVCTIHRAENTDDAGRLAAIIGALRDLPVPAILLTHPRLAAKAASAGIALDGGALRSVPPLAYPSLLAAVMGSRGVVTDSGGLQKEAYLLGVPCTTVRTETEWSETVETGWNVLDPEATGLRELAVRDAPDAAAPRDAYGDGRAAQAVVGALEERLRA